MKTRFIVFLLVISLTPESVFASDGCVNQFDQCYDSNLDLSVGDKFQWVVSNHLINNTPVNYGIDSDKLLTIDIQIINEIKDLHVREVIFNESKYLKASYTVAGLEMDLNETKLREAITLHLIQPTMILWDDIVINQFEGSVDRWTNRSNHAVGLSTTLDYTGFRSIADDIYSFNETMIFTRNNDSYRKSYEFFSTQINVNSGVVQEREYIWENNEVDEQFSYLIILGSLQTLKLGIFAFSDNLPLTLGVISVIIVGVLVFILAYRKIQS